MEISIPKDVRCILNKLTESGYEAYIVGGCVRDSIMGTVPHDWDICTSAFPQQVIDVFSNVKVIPTGLRHGTVTIELSSGLYEITTYRVDGEYSDNRHPDNISFTGSLSDDLERRDFTINALAYNPQEGLIDLFGGVKDIKDGIIRCVGNPDKRFSEDALRILRAIRFASNLSFKIDKRTLISLVRNMRRLKNISMERINAETAKILDSYELNRLNVILMLSCLKTVLPEIKICPLGKIHSLVSPAYHTSTFDGYRRLIVRLAILFGDDADILRKMKFSKSVVERTVKVYRYGEAALSNLKYLPETGANYFVRKMISEIGYEASIFAAEYVAINDLALYVKLYSIIKEVRGKCNSIGEMAINGDDLISIGYSGKKIGWCLNYLLNDILWDRAENDYASLMSKAKGMKKLSK